MTDTKMTFSIDEFNPKKAELLELKDSVKNLKIENFDDKEGYQKVREARIKLMKARTGLTKTGKKIREGAKEFISKVIGIEKDFIQIIQPEEVRLKEMEDNYVAEQERRKKEKEEKKRLALQKRVDELAQYNYSHQDLFELSNMSEQDYNEMLLDKKTLFEEAEKIRKEKEEAERIEKLKNCLTIEIVHCRDLEQLDNVIKKIESEGFDVKDFEETIEYRKSSLTLEEEKRKIEAEKKRLQDEKDNIEKEKADAEAKKKEEERLVKIKKEADKKAKKDLEEKLKKEKFEKAEKERIQNEKVAKEKKYKEFLAKHDGKYDGFFDKDGTRVLYKIVGSYKFN